MKTLLISTIVILMFVNCACAATDSGYSFNGNGLPEYPNSGTVWTSVDTELIGTTVIAQTPTYSAAGNVIYFAGHASISATATNGGVNDMYYWNGILEHLGMTANHVEFYREDILTGGYENKVSFSDHDTFYDLQGACAKTEVYIYNRLGARVISYTTGYISPYPITEYTLSGSTNCVDNVKIYMVSGTDYTFINETILSGEDSYSEQIYSNATYRVVFSDGHYEQFICTGNKICDYNACINMNIYLKDYCGNMMTNTSADIYKSNSGEMSSYEFIGNYWNTNPIVLSVNDTGEGKMLDIYFDTDMGTYHQIEFCEEKSVDLLHPFKTWSIDFGVFDDMTHDPIENIKIIANQSCKPDPNRLLTTYGFTDVTGYKLFSGLSAQKVYVKMDNNQYTGDRFWVDGLGDAFHTYHILDTYLNLSGEIDWYNNSNLSDGCNIHFKDQNGNVDNHINDTDTYVDLYYDNGNCSATLKFQRLYSTYWMTKESYNIPINESGYKRILNANFSTSDACYRAIMQATECECNASISLYVTNQTIEEEMHYENLTTFIRFNDQLGNGQIDYRENVAIKAYAYSNTSAALLDVNLTLYELSNQIATVNLDWADFAGANPKWYYLWEPNVNYDIGKNYTVIMTGYNGLNLCADDVWTSNIRRNALTVNIKDNYNNPVSYATVFIESWGSIAIGVDTGVKIEDLENGNVQYKATKSGYQSEGWNTVVLNGSDESVTCILVKQTAKTVTGYKLKDNEIKAFFIPIMYLIFILIVLGAFMYLAGGKT